MLPSNLLKGYCIKASLSQPRQEGVRQSIKDIFRGLSRSSKAATSQTDVQLFVKGIPENRSKYSRFARKSSKMPTTCPKCNHLLIHPPSLFSLHKHFPTQTVDATLDRSQPRCRHCDEMLASKLALEAELPPPSFSSLIVKLEKAIQTLKKLIEENIDEEEDERTLKAMVHNMQLRWATMVKKRDADIKLAWKLYWAIWGLTKGQEVYPRVCRNQDYFICEHQSEF